MKKKKGLRIVATAIGLTLAAGLVCGMLSACGNSADALVLSTDQPDGVFNPFFYTSGADGDIVGQTMIGMISTDKDGKIVAGENEPCVAYDYSVVTTGDSEHSNEVDGIDSTYYTDYYFAIKDDIVFSDGTPLTMKDVLFNIYMYLDPAYTGSATMYSVDIQGLTQYRTQSDTATEEDFDSAIGQEVSARVNVILDWAEDDKSTMESFTGNKADFDKIDELFRQELESDWNVYQTADLKEYEKYVDRNGKKLITESWQVFLYNYNAYVLQLERDAQGNKYYTVTTDVPPVEKTKDALIQYVFDSKLDRSIVDTYKDNLVQILNYYATANTFRQYVRGQVIKEQMQENGMRHRTISGITTERMSALPISADETKPLDKERDVLHIRINKEDPKAIQNFGFTVAPLHYYSPTADKFTLEKNNEYFGVEFGDSEFMDKIRVIQVPLGAGPYRASTLNGTAPDQVKNIEKTQFFNNNVVYFESNENFFLGAPKIKKLRYKVISTSLLYESVKTGEINFSTPSATQEIMNNLNGTDKNSLDFTITDTLGYGYIGINANYVHDINIRKAIMSAMDTSLCIDYYGSGQLASAIYRPMSTTLKDYYPQNATAYYPYDGTGKKSLEYAQKAGYTPDSDGFLKDADGNRLKFTFTIAGDSEDHPAYHTMDNAAELLNKNGFDVTVTRDSTALSKLSAGRLEVWAAAWSSSSDPDMYQVYHKKSSATSILAWGFPWIESDGTEEERALLDELANRIEDGRETTVTEERRKIYSETTNVSIAEGSTKEELCALDLVMELAVELPTYQRKTLYVYKKDFFDDESLKLFAQSTAYQSPLSRIWEIDFRK